MDPAGREDLVAPQDPRDLEDRRVPLVRQDLEVRGTPAGRDYQLDPVDPFLLVVR
jgi:hypothetical protein